MRIFNFKQDKRLLDLTENYNPEPASVETDEENMSVNERRAKLVKRLTDMTDKIDGLSSQIYKLQQRVELLEKKANVRSE